MQKKSLEGLRICVLQPSYKDSNSVIKDYDFRRDLSKWIPKGCTVEHVFLEKATAVKEIMSTKADVFVNLCDGAWDEDAPGIDVVFALQRMKKAFTGSGSRFYDPSREEMKAVCHYWDIPTPNHAFVYCEQDIDSALTQLKFPMFVKHYHGYNSVGITEKSKVYSAEELRREAKLMLEQFGGALVEEFIDGREFSVLVSSNADNEQEPFVYKPVECEFAPGINFKTFDYKWNGAKNPWKVVNDSTLAEQLEELTVRMFLALGGEGYARTDIRVDADGKLWLLEINPNCSVFYPDDNGGTADEILQWDGTGKSEFLERLLAFALHRHRRSNPAWQVRRTDGGLGLFASRDIRAGDNIYVLEEQPLRLVSKAHVERTWGPRMQQFFRDYCWPLSPDLWVMWDADPEAWKPINHCCDPNTWVEGLDLVARRDIKAGEQLTMDYATMYADVEGPDFVCRCGVTHCRGGWKADDYRQEWFRQRYGTDHVTDFVLQKMKNL